MKIRNVGYNHCHDSDFFVDRPEGSGDCLMLVIKSGAVVTIDGKDVKVPENSVFIYPKGRPQIYRCLYQSVFSNDWVHFEFEGEEEKNFSDLGLGYETSYHFDNLNFISMCVKGIAAEHSSANRNRKSTAMHYMFLIFNRLSDSLENTVWDRKENYYEVLSTIRNKIYSRPYEIRTAESTAHEVRMSVSNFQHLYKKYFGVSFVQDLIKSRIEYACMLLKSTNLSSEEVAHQSGYNHYAHFVRQFRGHTGVSPSEYRKG